MDWQQKMPFFKPISELQNFENGLRKSGVQFFGLLRVVTLSRWLNIKNSKDINKVTLSVKKQSRDRKCHWNNGERKIAAGNHLGYQSISVNVVSDYRRVSDVPAKRLIAARTIIHSSPVLHYSGSLIEREAWANYHVIVHTSTQAHSKIQTRPCYILCGVRA